MKTLLPLILLIVAWPSLAAEPQTITIPATAVVAPAADTPGIGNRIGLIERRRLGLTTANMVRAARELKTEGAWPADAKAQSQAILAKLIDENPDAYLVPAIDWDGLLAFIERLIPLILKLIELFGGI